MIKWIMKLIQAEINLFTRDKIEKISEAKKETIKELFNKKRKDVINLTPVKVYVIDEKYNLTNIKNIQKFLLKDLTNYKNYSAEKSDCDDFAIKLWARFKELHPNFALGFAISNSHAFNIFIDDQLKIWIIEPQTDRVFEYKNVKSKYKLKMVII